MATKADTATNTGVPAVLTISSGIWQVFGAVGAVWSLLRLLLLQVMGGMLEPEAYLPTLAVYIAGGAVSVTGIVCSVLLKKGGRPARIVLSAYVVIVPVFVSLLGDPSAGSVPGWESLLSTVGAVVVIAGLATVLMWLPPANAYFAAGGARTLEAPAGSAASDRVPPTVTVAVRILVASGAFAALEAGLGLLLLSESIGTDAKTTPALVLYLTLASAAVANFACAMAVRRGKPFVRAVVTAIPAVGLTLVVLATIAAYSNVPAGSAVAEAGVLAAILLTVFSQGLPLLGSLAAAILLWLPSARRFFRPGAEAHPAGTSGS